MAGHVFVVAPVGNVGTAGFPSPSHDSALNGDGLIYRFDLADGVMTLRTRLVRSADYYTDLVTDRELQYRALGYFNAGIIRMSAVLGARNYGNTALMGFSFDEGAARVAATFDGGRPLELDPKTLSVVTPVGALSEWRSEAVDSLPFPPILSTAHPAVDQRTREIFLVNYGRSVASIAARSGPAGALSVGPERGRRALSSVADRLGLGPLGRGLRRLSERVVERVLAPGTGARADELPRDFLYVVRWDGATDLRRFRVVAPSGEPLAVRQTMHQIAITRHWLVLMDTSMKVSFDQAYNSPFGPFRGLGRLLRRGTTAPQPADTILHFIRRSDLEETTSRFEGEPSVVAHTLTVPLESVHFLADYDDAGDEVVLHVAHNCAQDVAEWVRDFDRGQFTGRRSPRALWGVPNVTPLDIHRLARYRIHAPTSALRERVVISDRDVTWALSLYGGARINTLDPQPAKLKGMFHVALGFQPDLVTRFIYELYARYPHREVPLSEIDRIGRDGGKPANIFYIDLESYAITDVLELSSLGMVGAIQFVPRAGGVPDDPRDGYLLAMVIDDGRREVWVLDAADLARGPLCRLSHPGLSFGATLHSFYLPTLGARTSPYRVAPQQDYGERVVLRPLTAQLFAEHVYPHFPEPRASGPLEVNGSRAAMGER